jgi:hypothetical protein
MYKSSSSVIFLVILFTMNVHSQDHIRAVDTDVSPVIDGWIREDCWIKAAAIDEFYQREPKTGEPVSERTRFLF